MENCPWRWAAIRECKGESETFARREAKLPIGRNRYGGHSCASASSQNAEYCPTGEVPFRKVSAPDCSVGIVRTGTLTRFDSN